MKTFTFNDIKEFCKTHYREYLAETETAITFSFLDQGYRRTTTFIDMVEGRESGLSGTFKYLGYAELVENIHMFNFKRIA